MNTVVRSGIEGTVTPIVKEYGFNKDNFPGNYYSAYDFTVTNTPSSSALPSSEYPLTFQSAGSGLQLGDANMKGSFCEKPSYCPSLATAVYFPLGTGPTTSTATRGFYAQNFFDGGTAEILQFDRDQLSTWAKTVESLSNLANGVTFTFTYNNGWCYNGTLISNFTNTTGITVTGNVSSSSTFSFTLKVTILSAEKEAREISNTVTSNISAIASIEAPLSEYVSPGLNFSEEVNYDREYCIDYRGASSTGGEVNNLLKYPVVSTETVTETLTSTEIYSYKILNFENAYSITVTKNGTTLTEGTDYILSTNGLIRSLADFEKDSVINITINRHNYWVTSWNATNNKATVTSIPNNFLNAEDAVEINYKNNNFAIFYRPITITEEGWYNFSGYFKLNSTDVSKAGYIRGLHLTSNSASLTDSSSRYFYYTDFHSSVEKVTVSDTSYRRFKIGTSWGKIAQSVYLSPGDYYATISWEYLSANASDSLSVAGLCLVKGREAPTYDYRQISYTSFEKETQPHRPLIFHFENQTVATDWALAYTRFISTDMEARSVVLDTIGNLQVGYDSENIKIVLDGEELTLSPQEFLPLTTDPLGVYVALLDEGEISFPLADAGNNYVCATSSAFTTAEDLYCNYEKIYIRYHRNENIIRMIVLGLERSYYVDIPLGNDFEFNQTLEGVPWNLMLGCYEDSNGLVYCPSIYRGVWWFPEALSDEDIDPLIERNKFLYQRFGVTRGTHIGRAGETDTSLVMMSEFLREGSPA